MPKLSIIVHLHLRFSNGTVGGVRREEIVDDFLSGKQHALSIHRGPFVFQLQPLRLRIRGLPGHEIYYASNCRSFVYSNRNKRFFINGEQVKNRNGIGLVEDISLHLYCQRLLGPRTTFFEFY